MTSQNNLEIKGNLQFNPLCELLVETVQAGLTGSFRLAHETQKIVVYLNNGHPVFAASNARQHRLFEILLQNNQITKDQLREFPNFTNDIQLNEALKSKGLFSAGDMDFVFAKQIELILKTALGWNEGEWVFSALTRIKETIQFEISLQKLLLEHARTLPQGSVVKRFSSFSETFGLNPWALTNIDLLPQEAFLLSRFEKSFLTVEEVKTLSGLSDVLTLKILYSLWLGGFLFRQNWNPAFSEKKISQISSAKLSLKKEELESVQPANSTVGVPVSKTIIPPVEELPEVVVPKELPLEEYLSRAENSDSYYEFFDVAPNANLSEIKRTYFSLAKLFHPDKFHQEKNPELLQRIQDAFTKAAQAYEILKDDETRKTYDYKLSKNLTSLKTKESSAKSLETIKSGQIAMAKESFDQGFSLLTEDEIEESVPFFARAVQLAPDNARYHAFYGKALSSDESQRFKADTEMQTAIRLEPQNATFRLIMAEFYIQFGLFRRAEGELQRLLSLFPGNQEALALLDTLPKK